MKELMTPAKIPPATMNSASIPMRTSTRLWTTMVLTVSSRKMMLDLIQPMKPMMMPLKMKAKTPEMTSLRMTTKMLAMTKKIRLKKLQKMTTMKTTTENPSSK